MVSLDLITALVLVIGAVIMAILIMPTLSHEDRDWRIKQYMTATRVTDALVQDEGNAGWETNWTPSNYANVTKIGFVYVDNGTVVRKVLNLIKIQALMGEGYIDIETNTTGTNTTWWEFPNPTTSKVERENATRALGLEGYNFYMQLHPIGLEPDLFNSTPLQVNLTNHSKVPISDDTVSVVDRYVYIKSNGEYIKYKNKAVHYRLNLWVW